MKYYLVCTMFLVLACGDDESKEAAPAPTQIVAQETTTEDDRLDALYLEPGAEMPACTKEDEGWLVYLEGFKACRSGMWADLDISGKDGKDGLNGKDGIAGKNGADGKDGQVIYVDGEYWQDPFTGLTWRVFGVNADCADGYRLPSVDEIAEASNNGIFVALDLDHEAYKTAWTDELHLNTGNKPKIWSFLDDDWTATTAADDILSGTYCVETEEQAFNWLAPLDEHCYGSLDFETAQPSYGCYKIEHGIEPWDVRAS